MNLGVMLNKNYNDIATIAKRITRQHNRGSHDDLINSTYLKIHESGTVIPTDETEFKKMYVRWMHNSYKFKDSGYNEVHRPKEIAFERIELVEFTEDYKEVDITKYKRFLMEYEQILFELYFEKGLTFQKISSMVSGDGYRVTLLSIRSMIINLKNKIKKMHYEGVY